MLNNPLIKAITENEFEFFKEIVYKESGIKLSDLKKALVQSRLLKRMRILQIRGYNNYALYLKKNYKDEITNFINVITTNKTEFFREIEHFKFLENTAFPEFKNFPEKEIRIWSAGCSTGEEPYSIAITALENFKNNSSKIIKILATDIDTQVLSNGENGYFKKDTMQAVPLHLQKKYFLKGVDENKDFFKVKDNLKEIIFFHQLNLQQKEYPMKKQFHAIFCRNVIIYFDKKTQQELFKKLYNYLDDRGYLFIGHSESLNTISKQFKFIGKTIYKKIL